MIRFSVAMSVYKNDSPVFLNEALNSILINQTVLPDEVVLVIDGFVSKEIKRVIEKYRKEYCGLRIIELKENLGLGNALKIAVENCSYAYVARMDSDDISTPNRFKKQIDYITNNKNIDIVGGNIAEFINNKNEIISKRIVPTSDKEIKQYIKKRCPFNHMTVMFKKSSVIKAGNYIDWFQNEDYYLWIRMVLNNATMANIDEILVNVRVGNEMYMRRGGIKYFISEHNIQRYMKEKGIINNFRFFINVVERFIVQVLLPNRIRSLFFVKIARKEI